MERFVSSIKRKYKEKLVNRDKQWPPCHVNKLIRLKIVENNKSRGYFSWPWGRRGYRRLLDENLKKATISYDDLFKAENMVKPVRKVLVEGDAGIGKTTLCISVSEDWANGKLFQQFKLVLLLPLRMKAVSSASSLPELLQLLHPSRSICESVASYIEEEEGENVLIIADGWDELGKQVQEESFVYQLLFHLFPFMSVVVTSRPSACHSLHHLPNIDRFIEVCGFSNEHIIQYIHSEFSGDEVNIGHFLEQLENNPLLESVCSIPLNCAIVCHLWRVFEEALPMTMTELYTSIMLNVVLHNLRKTDSHRTISSLSSFDSLPVNLQQSWWLLCEFAFQMLKDDQLVFTQDEFTKFFPKGFALDEEILCFGLLQSAESIILETGYGISLHFLHLTFQEFLAAMHIARQPPEKLWNIIQSLQSAAYISGGRLQMMWRFLFGILFRGSNIEAQHNIISNIRKTLMYVSGTLKRPNNMLACHCSFEAQNVFINIEVTEFLAGRKSHGRASFGYPRTAHDCAAVLYVISNMWEGDSIVINFANSGVREYQILTLVNLLADRAKTFKVTEFYLSGNRLTLPSLQALQEAVFGDMLTNLKRLYLTRSLTDDADTNGAWLSVFIGSLLAHCPHLTHFDVSCNNLGVPGARAFADSLSKLYNHTSYDSSLDCALKEQELGQFLTNIDFTDTNLYNDGLVAFVKGLECSCNFDEVSLKANHISVTGASCLADAICLGIIAINGELNISDNPIKLEGTTVFGHILSNEHNKSAFKGVNLSKCELTTVANGSNPLNTDSSCFGSDSSVNEAIRDVGKQLLQMPQNTNITQLILDGNSFAGMGINILAGFIHLTPCLNNLNTCNCSISSDEVLQLLEKLLELKSSSPNLFNCLKHWKLDNNNISDSGISALVDCLSSLFTGCSKLSFCLDNNPVSSEMIKRLKEELKRCQQPPSTFEPQELPSLTALRISLPRVLPLTTPEQPKTYQQDNSIDEGEKNTEKSVMQTSEEEPKNSTNWTGCTPRSIPGTPLLKKPKLTIEGADQQDYTNAVEYTHVTLPTYQPFHHPEVTQTATSASVITQTEISTSQPGTSSFVERLGFTESCGIFSDNDMNVPSTSPQDENGTMVIEILAVTDLASVQQAVWEGRAKWYNLGLQLGLSAGTLDAIQRTNYNHSDHCFTATLREWLTRSDLQPSWSSLARSLRASPVGLEDLANHLPPQNYLS